MMKVTGKTILAFLEVKTTVTAKAKLLQWGFNPEAEYVVTEELVKHWSKENKEEEEVYVSYKSKSSGSGRL